MFAFDLYSPMKTNTKEKNKGKTRTKATLS
jgi:hypothetical protein